MEEHDSHVMSEIHLGCPPHTNGPFLSRFTISLPLAQVGSGRFWQLLKCGSGSGSGSGLIELDEDGDLLLPRRTISDQSALSFAVTIQHCITSSLRDVGLQVWKAELVLSDFVLHKMCASSELDDIVCLEVGAGTGLLGILLARVAKSVFLTDYGDDILVNCAQNVGLNSSLFDPQATVNVRELNWMSEWPVEDSHGDCRAPEKFSWSSLDIEQVKRVTVIFAADVIYSDDLTVGLFTMLKRLMSLGSEKVLYMCLEKRYNFSVDDLDVVANGYACFRSYVKDASDGDEKSFVGKRVDVTQIPRYVKGYDRGEDVELWEIRYLNRPTD